MTRRSNAAEIPLPPPRIDGKISVEAALRARRSVREFQDAGLTLAEAAQLLWAAQGVTNDEGDRTAPSAGALQPLEAYLVAGDVAGLAPGVYRYAPPDHALVGIAQGDRRAALTADTLDQAWVRAAPAVLVLAAVVRRTERKYGDRARRYVHFEVGHAAQNVYLQAEGLGLATVIVGAFEDDAVRRTLGLPRRTEPLAIMPVGRPR